MYKILPYTKRKARQLNVVVRPSTRKGKKIDVFDKNGYYLTSVGARGYLDYPTYLKMFGSQIANKRRRLYKIRHAKDRIVRNSPGWYANNLLW